MFDKFQVQNLKRPERQEMKRQSRNRLLCLDCRAGKNLACAACKGKFEKEYWSVTERKNHVSAFKTPLVCKTCRAKGYSPKDLTAYTCQICANVMGGAMFDKSQLKNYNYHGRKAVQCKECASVATDRLRVLQERMRKSKRRCTCYANIHKDKCPLTPVVFGEKRWPGSDGAVTAEDRKFLDSLRPPPAWWRKAWGK